MSNFTIRVELLNYATEADYENLYGLMEASNCYRKIQDFNGIWYDLPPAEYQCISDDPIEAVRNSIAQIARSVHSPVRVRVTEGLSAWVGLERSTYQGGAHRRSLYGGLLGAPSYH